MGSNVIDIKILAKDLASDVLRGVGDQLNTAGFKAIKLNSILQIATTVFSGLASAARTAWQAVRDLAVKGFNFLLETALSGADLQRLRTVNEVLFENLPEGVKKAIPSLDAFRDSLKEANASGSGAEKAIGALLRNYELMDDIMGLERGEATGLSAFMLKIKDLAAAMGISSTEGIDKFVDAIVAGKTESIDALGITGNLATEFRDFATQLDLTSGELSEAERQQALFNFVMEEADKVMGAYEATREEAGKGMNSLRDAIKGATEELGLRMQPVFNLFVQGFLTLAERVEGFITSERFTAFMEVLNEKIVGFITGVGQSFRDWWTGAKDTIMPLLGELKTSIQELFAEFSDLGDGVTVNKEQIKEFVTQGVVFAITEGRKFIDILKESIRFLREHPEIIEAVKLGFKVLGASILAALNFFSMLSSAIQDVINKVNFLSNKLQDPNLFGAAGSFFNRAGSVVGFASGTEFVPRDMIVKVHRGEQIIPARQASSDNNITVNVTGNTIDSRSRVDEIVAEIKRALATDNQNSTLGLNNAYM